MLEALIAGTHDPAVLAELACGRLRAKLPALREALEGRFRSEHHGLLVAQILAHIDYLDETIATLSARIEEVLAPFSRQRELLETIPGIGRTAAQVLIAPTARNRYGSFALDFLGMEMEQAMRGLLELLDANGGSLRAADVEGDDKLAQDQPTVSAAAHALATESDIITGEETDARQWFPYSFMTRVPTPGD